MRIYIWNPYSVFNNDLFQPKKWIFFAKIINDFTVYNLEWQILKHETNCMSEKDSGNIKAPRQSQRQLTELIFPWKSLCQLRFLTNYNYMLVCWGNARVLAASLSNST